jgi:hypothetical protein
VRYSDTEPDSCAHGGLAPLYTLGDGTTVFGLKLAFGHELVDQLINGLPAVFSPQVNDGGLRAQKVVQIHC